MEALKDWITEIVVVVLGVVFGSLWRFRENTNSERYSSMEQRVSALEDAVIKLQADHQVIVERVDTIGKRQERIAQVTDDTLSAVGRIEGYLQALGKTNDGSIG